MSNGNVGRRQLLHGTKAIARHVLGDERYAWKIRRHCDEWPLFLVGNVLCGYADALDAALAAKERAGLESLKPITRKHPSARNLELSDA